MPGQAQHLQDVVEGFRGQKTAPDGGLGQPGGQQGKIGKGDGAFTVLEFTQFLDLPEWRLELVQIGKSGSGLERPQEFTPQVRDGVSLNHPEQLRKLQGGQRWLWHSTPGFRWRVEGL